jgi:hypothetical protein
MTVLIDSTCVADTDPVQESTGYVYGTGMDDIIYNVQGTSVRPIALADYYILNYKLLCLKDR